MALLGSVLARREQALDKELQFHLEEQIRANLAAGMSPEEARRQAILEFGGVEQVKEECRDERRSAWVEQLGQDFRHAWRQLARARGFTAVVVLTLALGIGASIAIFTVVTSVLLRPIPYPGSERIVAVHESRAPQYPKIPVSLISYQAWSRGARDVFASIYAERIAAFNVTGVGEPERVRAAADTEEFFATLGVQPALGRAFLAEEYTPGRDHVVILNHGFWQRQLGGQPEVVGSVIRLDGQPYIIVGIMPPDFQREGAKDILMPLAFTETDFRNAARRHLAVFARLKPEVSVASAQAHLTQIAQQLALDYPETHAGQDALVLSILFNRTAESRPLLFSLAGAVTLLLLIACTNVANLLLVRAASRERELAVRIALGATRRRLFQQFMAETLLLSLTSAVLGLAVAKAGLILLLNLVPPTLPRATYEIAMDGSAVAVAVGLALATGVVCGLVPFAHCTRLSRRGPGSKSVPSQFGRYGFIVAEIALAIVLLSGAGVLVRNFAQIAAFDSGLKPQGVLVASTVLPREKYASAEQRAAFGDAALARLKALPAVVAAAVGQSVPGTGDDFQISVAVEHRDLPRGSQPLAQLITVSGEFFATLGIHLVAGRTFDAHDRAGSVPVAIVSQALAATLFPDGNAIGQRIAPGNRADVWHEIVGIVSDVKPYGGGRDRPPQLYTAFAQAPSPVVTFLVRTDGHVVEPHTLRREIRRIDPEQPIVTGLLNSVMRRAFARQEFALLLFATFSAMALLFAGIGIYSVVAFSVARRRGEIGVRIALGARPADLVRFVMREAGRIASWGIVLGVLAAFAVSRLLQAVLVVTPGNDLVVFAAIVGVLYLVALAASIVPARRATRVDPVAALRAE